VHNNFYFLSPLAKQLHEKLLGFTLVSCFSQNKDELVIEFNNANESFIIKASLQPDFACLSFPKNFNRARKNSIDLFNQALMKPVKAVKQFSNERSFAIMLADNYSLLFKMHGNRANVILFEDNYALDLFRKNMVADIELKFVELDRTIDWSRDAFDSHRNNLPVLYFTFGKWVWLYLKEKGFFEMSADEQWKEINHIKTKLEQSHFYHCNYRDTLIFTLLPLGGIQKEYTDPVAAIHDFYSLYTVSHALLSEKATVKKILTDRITAGENYVKRNQSKLDELVNDHHYQLWGDLVMAHMHELKPGTERVILNSFYDSQPIEIKLKKELNPQKNAEVFYRKAKNQQIEIAKLKESIAIKLKDIENLRNSLHEVEAIDDLKALRKTTEKNAPKPKEQSLPYYEFVYKGFKIWVGKNAVSNDELTLKYGYKEDLWLHVKDVAGSHVIIKHQAGKTFPKDVIERAAQLAAYNSKRKTEALCAVVFTPKKFVRKRKGDPAGAVVVEKEEVILVEPKL
jgi:predicted ribosome quality control (RQC) complex YloA/Tae2 family protein